MERRRRFSDEEKLRLVEEAFQPGAKATAVARRLGVDFSLLYRWRRQFFGPQLRLPAFLPITIATGEPDGLHRGWGSRRPTCGIARL